MRIGSQRNSRTLRSSQSQQTHFEILPVSIAINLNRLVEVCRFGKDAAPICSQTFSVIVNACLRMTEDVNAFGTQSRQIAIGLVFGSPKRGMKRANDKVQFGKCKIVNVWLAYWRKVHLGGFQNSQVSAAARQGCIGRVNLVSLFKQSLLVEPVSDL
jgi:hypothetical protein